MEDFYSNCQKNIELEIEKESDNFAHRMTNEQLTIFKLGMQLGASIAEKHVAKMFSEVL